MSLTTSSPPPTNLPSMKTRGTLRAPVMSTNTSCHAIVRGGGFPKPWIINDLLHMRHGDQRWRVARNAAVFDHHVYCEACRCVSGDFNCKVVKVRCRHLSLWCRVLTWMSLPSSLSSSSITSYLAPTESRACLAWGVVEVRQQCQGNVSPRFQNKAACK